jgi:GH25 family lysozyme M1 (1,4-beta-N-acetylmuramidase)
MRKGIDVSTWQKTVKWPDVKAAGVEFVMIRGGFDTTLDNMFDTHINGALSVGLPVGIYWFSYALTADEAKAEARKCLEVIKPYKITYPVAYDFEGDSVKYASAHGVTMTKELATAIVKAFCDEIANAGYTAYVYSNPDYLKNYIDKDKVGRELWLACYTGRTPETETQAANCRIWQYKVGSCAGVDGSCDLDVWYDDADIAMARKPKEVSAPAGNIYTVVKGDTPWGIAGKLLGNSFRYTEIMKLNGLAEDADIYAGQVLKIPDKAAVTKPAGRTYTVVKNDTLWGIASKLLKNGARYTEIKKLNGLKTDIIHAGQVLKIPNK